MSTTAQPDAAQGAASSLAVVEQMFAAFASGNADAVDALCSPDLVEHQFGMSGTGEDAIRNVKQAIRELHTTVPDISFTIEDSVVDGDKTWVRVTARGTATGPFFGPPSGRPVTTTVFDTVRVVDGRIAEHWGVPDRFALLAQTGVLDRLAAGR